MKTLRYYITASLLLVSTLAMAQISRISGTVSDDIDVLPGVNVVEIDESNRVVNAIVTDMNGNFVLPIKSPKNKLVVSYVGSKTKIITIGDQKTFTIKLEDDKTTLGEVKVVGRRSTSGGLNIDKREISVSQQTFNLQEIEGMAFTSADEALQGEIAGLDIVANSGNLGSGTSMRLRGVSTLNGNAEPLIVVDDKIFGRYCQHHRAERCCRHGHLGFAGCQWRNPNHHQARCTRKTPCDNGL